MANVVIVAKKGANLPVGACVLVEDGADAYVVKAAAKTGKGRGTKTVLRQFVIPKSEVAYMYKEKEISAEEAAQYPMSNGVKHGVHAVAAPADTAPVVRRKRRTKAELAAGAEGPAPAAKRGRKPKADKVEGATKRKRRTKAEMEAARAAGETAGGPTKRKRRTKAEMEAARAAGETKAPKAAKAPKEPKAPKAPKPEGTKRKRRTKAEMEAARAAGETKAPKAAPAPAAPPADKPADVPAKAKGMSLFGDF